MKKAAPAHRLTLLLLLVRLLTLVLPTAVAGAYVLYKANVSYTALDMGIATQIGWFAAALTVSYIVFAYRGRFLIFTPLLLLTLWLIGRSIRHLPGEFDVFVAVARFDWISALIWGGWFIGFFLTLSRWLLLVPTALFLTLTLVSISDNTTDLSPEFLLVNLLPILMWVLYMLFMAPALQDMADMDRKRAGNLLLRTIGFLGLIVLAFFLITETYRGELKAKEAEITQRGKESGKGNENEGEAGKGKGGKNGGQNKGGYNEKKGLLERPAKLDKNGQPVKPEPGDDDSGLRLKDTMQMNDRMSQNDYVMFCARLDNYFPDGSPKPLYYAYHHLTRYDPQKEQFMRDPTMPFFDELSADPAVLPLYKTVTDSSVIRNSLATKKRKVIETEVYISSNTWKHALLAPNAAFSVQTIPIDKGFDTLFRFAYKVKCYSTTLTTTYAMEKSASKPQVAEELQESYVELNKVPDYAGTDPNFFRYYTSNPQGSLYDSIRKLAEEITKDAKTPLEKVDAIDQYFRSKGPDGKPLFRYTLTPGKNTDPNIPSASMLGTFLFRTHAGYCTYFSGATVFLLRSVGVPCRFTTGFATIDRSDKNKGWYWFYGRQAHAWTQVYFPGYGWIDFDTTVGNSDQGDAPKPDGTPPLPPPQPWLVVRAKTTTDASNKKVDADFQQLTFDDDEYLLETTTNKRFDVSLCRVKYGLRDTTLAALLPGDSVLMVAYDDPSRKLPKPRAGVAIDDQVAQFPVPIVVDELHIQPRPEPKKAEPPKPAKKPAAKKEPVNKRALLLLIGGIVGGLVLLLLFLPQLIWLWLSIRAKAASGAPQKAERIYRLALYTFHQTVLERGTETAYVYATQRIDPLTKAGFGGFVNVYLKLKYANLAADAHDENVMQQFWPAFVATSKKTVGGGFRWWLKFFNLARAQRFLRRLPTEAAQAPTPTQDV